MGDDDDDELLADPGFARTSQPCMSSSVAKRVSSDEIAGEVEWNPIFYKKEWKDKNLTKCISFIINMPSGVASQDSKALDPKITDQGMTLSISVDWPEPMTDVDAIFDIIEEDDDEPLSDDMTRAKFQLKEEVQEMKGNIRKKMRAVAKFPLPFPICEKIDRIELTGHDDGTDVLFATLKAPTKDYLDVGIIKKKRKKRSS